MLKKGKSCCIYVQLSLQQLQSLPLQNDPGSDPDPQTGARHFTTYLKARIYCEREVPPGREYTGALDYQYNEMSEH